MLIHSIGDKQRLSAFYRQYESVMRSNLPTHKRNAALASLMTDMEREFHIPMLRNEEWEQQNKPVIALYRIISMSRGRRKQIPSTAPPTELTNRALIQM